MVLIVEEGCQFCESFKSVKGLAIAKLLSNLQPPMLELDGSRMPLPFGIVGLPTLLDGEKVYVGRALVTQRLEQMAAIN